MTIEIDSPLETIVSLITIVGAIAALYTFGYKRGFNKARNDVKFISMQKSYELVYAPLRKALLDTHISTATYTRYGWFNQRWERSKSDLVKFKLLGACRKLFDKGTSKPTAGVDHGDFPIEEIRAIIKENLQWADSGLIRNLQYAERSRIDHDIMNEYYNKPPDGILTNYEFDLVNHILDTYYKLNKELFPKK